MASATLTQHDVNVLEKIKDPDFDPSTGVQLDSSLGRDPHITDSELYEQLVRKEQNILASFQHLEIELAGLILGAEGELVHQYKACIDQLSQIINEFPDYASAKNNRAQALRRLYGDSMLVTKAEGSSQGIALEAAEHEVKEAAVTALTDLGNAIRLLSPQTCFAALSPQQARTLSLAHTQRAAIYHETAKRLSKDSLNISESLKEKNWERLQFEEAASQDFTLGGRYGCNIAKSLAVSTNPTAKLCGQIVREAMKKEYGPEYGY